MATPLEVTRALAFVQQQGVVLASARGDAPRLVEAILGEAISGNWWAHPRSGFIYNVLAEVRDSEDVLVCRLLRGKLTLIHRRLWPALVRIADRFDPAQLAHVREEHRPNGRHMTREVPFPRWVQPSVRVQAELLTEDQAIASLGPAVASCSAARNRP